MTVTDIRAPEADAPDEWAQHDQAQTGSTTRRLAASEQNQSATGNGALVSGELIAAIALTLFSIAVGAGFARVFAGWQFFDNFVVIAVTGHAVGYLLRRLGVPGWIAVPALASLMVWLIGVTHYGESFSFFLPTSETLELFQAEISLVRQQFRTAVAPVIYGGGWDVLAAIGIGLTVVLSDTFAFRAFARAEALVPGGVLFVFIAALGFDRDRVSLTALLIGSGVIATIALRAHHAPNRPSAIGRQRSPISVVVPAAIGTALLVGVTAGFVGPRLPGADSDPIYETRGGDGGSVTEVISPLVDIRSRLTNRSDTELFVVQANFESYWRSSALPRFDGTTWGLPERALSKADGDLSTARDGSNELRQQIRITNLGGKFVPTAADPIQASPQENLRWNADSSTLLKTDGDLSSGDEFEIVSASPRFNVADLQAASSTDAGDPIYLELPDNFPSSVGDTARSVTAGAATPYETALTLQDWFRNEFDYSLEVQAGHGNNAIEGFLRERVGYCEQFAGTYAAMMRTLGIPARVAVGFTSGTNTGGGYSVLGKNAHAWPEVWFDGLGWVPFEPTPGRGSPGAENYTNVRPQQDASGVDRSAELPDQEPVVAQEPAVAVPTTVAGPAVTTPGQSNIPAGVDLTEATPEAATPRGGTDRSVPWIPLLLLAVLALAVGLPPAIRRWNRRRAPADPGSNVALLWRRSLDAVTEVGVRPLTSLTATEHANATALHFPVAARPIKSLAAAVTEVSYAPDGGTSLTAPDGQGRTRLADCGLWCRQVERAVNDSISPAARIRRYFTRLH